MNNILLIGRPGIGKTTVVLRLADLLTGKTIAGFHTEEIREAGQRQGFWATTFSGRSCVLAHVSLPGPHRVGRYRVNVDAFEQIVLAELTQRYDVMLIDEIGKMECFSTRFVRAVQTLLDGPGIVVATVAVSGGGLIAEAKTRPDVELWEVTGSNRDELPRRLAERVLGEGRGRPKVDA